MKIDDSKKKLRSTQVGQQIINLSPIKRPPVLLVTHLVSV